MFFTQLYQLVQIMQHPFVKRKVGGSSTKHNILKGIKLQLLISSIENDFQSESSVSFCTLFMASMPKDGNSQSLYNYTISK